MIENAYYWLLSTEELPTLAYYYRNPDAFMNPNVPLEDDKDYSALGFGFNTADGGGFLLETDVAESTTVMKANVEVLR